MNCIDVARGAAVRVHGPARIVVDKGSLLSAGYSVSAGLEIIVRSTRGSTLYAVEDSRICYSVGASGSLSIVKASLDTVESWMRVLEELESTGVKRILVIGGPDTGKSTFSLWARNRLKLCLVEADIGQNELGLPAMIAASRYDGVNYPVINDLTPHRAWFVGHVSADRVPDIVVGAVVKAASWCGSYVVDTDGFVSGRGLIYKLSMAKALEPDAIVVAGDKNLEKLVKPFADIVVTIDAPEVRERDRIDRRAYRERAYMSIFRDSSRIVLDASKTLVLNHEPCNVVEEGGVPVLDCNGKLYALGRPLQKRQKPIPVLRKGWEKGLLVGVESSRLGEAPGLLLSIDYVRGKIVLLAPREYVDGSPRYIILGFVRLDVENFTEVGRYEPTTYPTAIVRSTAAATAKLR